MKRLGALAIAVSVMEAAAQPSDAQAIHGVGADSCGSYVLALKEHPPGQALRWKENTYYTPTTLYTQWLLGFVTSENLRLPGGPGRQIEVDINGVALWIKNYCEANPSQYLVRAAEAFVRAHMPKRK